MIGWGIVTGKGMLTKGYCLRRLLVLGHLLIRSIVYPWGSLPEGTTISDIGGNNGHVTLDLIKSFPQLRVVLQDLPPVVDEGRKVNIP